MRKLPLASLLVPMLILACSDDNPGAPPDTTPPSVQWIQPANGDTLVIPRSITLQARATDNVAVSEVEFLADGGSLGLGSAVGDLYNYTWQTSPEMAGQHLIKARATDTSGNSAEESISLTLMEPPPR